jgi:hypothetical protein
VRRGVRKHPRLARTHQAALITELSIEGSDGPPPGATRLRIGRLPATADAAMPCPVTCNAIPIDGPANDGGAAKDGWVPCNHGAARPGATGPADTAGAHDSAGFGRGQGAVSRHEGGNQNQAIGGGGTMPDRTKTELTTAWDDVWRGCR